MINYEKLCLEVCELAKRVGLFIRQEAGKVTNEQIEDKTWNSLVSYVDKSAEKMLVSSLQRLVPEATFITEEGTINNSTSDLYWVIDPLDGTSNFLHQIPFYCTSIALVHNQELVVGVVYGIPLDECFYAWKGSKAYLNGQPIQVTSNQSLSKALTAIGFPYEKEKMDNYMDLLLYLSKNARGIRRLGSAALDLVYVACGRFDAYLEYGLNAWDVAGGSLIVQQAGGSVSDFSSGENFLFGQQMLATNTQLHPTFIKIIEERFLKSK